MSVLDDEKPAVWVHPPYLMLAVFISGFALRVGVGGHLPLPRVLGEGLGTALIILAIVLIQLAVATFVDGGEELRPPTPSRQLFTKGLYARTRNPIYLAMLLLGAGIGFATLNLWTLILTALAGVVLFYFVIKPEEHYLEERFGEDYQAYTNQVRRWF
ncbi:MAG: isoprenylcysteine carboxylmethyltransferase family protein [Pseudomonadota bacterium]